MHSGNFSFISLHAVGTPESIPPRISRAWISWGTRRTKASADFPYPVWSCFAPELSKTLHVGLSETDKEQEQLTYDYKISFFSFHVGLSIREDCVAFSIQSNIFWSDLSKSNRTLLQSTEKTLVMASANFVFPLLPSKDLFYILIMILEELNEDQDIHTYRLISKGWRAFIDQEILSNPVWREKFLQHPLRTPPEQRRPLVRDKIKLQCSRYSKLFKVFERGQYVLAIRGHPHSRATQSLVFTKTNAALKPVGSAVLKRTSCDGQGMHAYAMCQDYLFQLHPCDRPPWFVGVRALLQSYKKQDKTWITCNHPARQLWEQKGIAILGMRQGICKQGAPFAHARRWRSVSSD